MGDASFHWKPLGKRWNGSLIGAAPFHWKPLGKRWNGTLVGTSPFHWKPLGKQWNGRIHTSQSHHCFSSLHIWNYIYEITYMKLHRWNLWCNWWMEPHWQLLIKQWTGRFSVSLKTTRETMKWKRGSYSRFTVLRARQLAGPESGQCFCWRADG